MAKEKNYYKYATFLLVAILILFGLFTVWNSIMDSEFNNGVEKGQQNAIVFMLSEAVNKGYVTVSVSENQSVTLVPVQSVQNAQQNIISSIIGSVEEKGYVELNVGNNQSLVLLPYVPQETSDLSEE